MGTMSQWTVQVWPEAEGGFGGQCVELPGAFGHGDSEEETVGDVQEAIRLILETSKADIAPGAVLRTVEVTA